MSSQWRTFRLAGWPVWPLFFLTSVGGVAHCPGGVRGILSDCHVSYGEFKTNKFLQPHALPDANQPTLQRLALSFLRLLRLLDGKGFNPVLRISGQDVSETWYNINKTQDVQLNQVVTTFTHRFDNCVAQALSVICAVVAENNHLGK